MLNSVHIWFKSHKGKRKHKPREPPKAAHFERDSQTLRKEISQDKHEQQREDFELDLDKCPGEIVDHEDPRPLFECDNKVVSVSDGQADLQLNSDEVSKSLCELRHSRGDLNSVVSLRRMVLTNPVTEEKLKLKKSLYRRSLDLSSPLLAQADSSPSLVTTKQHGHVYRQSLSHLARHDEIKMALLQQRVPQRYLSAVRRLMSHSSHAIVESSSPSELCPSCREPFDKGKKRRLVDTCGHHRCYMCMFKRQQCPVCFKTDPSPAKLSKSGTSSYLGSNKAPDLVLGTPQSPSIISGRFQSQRNRSKSPALHGSVLKPRNGPQAGDPLVQNTPSGLRRYIPSPKLSRSPWLQHQRRSHLLGADNANNAKNSTEKSSHSRESGFQSSTSLASLDNQNNAHQRNSESPSSSTKENQNCGNSQVSSGSLVSLISGLSDPASLILHHNHRPTSRQSLSTLRQDSDSIHQPFRQLYWSLKPLFFEVPCADRTQLFVGRNWLFREIQDCITSDLPTNRGVIITGAPGSGKTAIILRLIEHSCFGQKTCEANYQELPLPKPDPNHIESIYGHSQLSLGLVSNAGSSSSGKDSMRQLADQVVAYHFCQADNAPTCLVPEFVHSIAAQMSQAPQLTPYYQLVNSDSYIQRLLSVPSCVLDPSNALVNGILQPLKNLRRLGKLGNSNNSQLCVIVIDGLCDAELHRPDNHPGHFQGFTIASFLSKHLNDFPPWLKIVCTIRTGMQDVTRSLPFQTINLDKTDVDERLNKDMTDYINLRINRSLSIQSNITPTTSKANQDTNPRERFLQFLVQVARGCFLYVRMTLDLLERGNLVIKSSSFNVLPLTLSEVYQLEFNLRFPSAVAFEKVQDILCVSLATLIPLTPPQLFKAITALKVDTHMQWGEFLMRFSALNGFLVRRADDTLMFFHPSFRDWLTRRMPGESKKFICDPRNGHLALAMAMCRDEGEEANVLGPDQVLEIGHHILKAHVYKNQTPDELELPARDLQATWISLATDSPGQLGLDADLSSLALGSIRNIANPNVKVSRLLLLAGASPNHRTDYLNGAPLVAVFAHRGLGEMVSLLIEFGADVDLPCAESGANALILAAAKGHVDIVRQMIQQGAKINVTDNRQMCALAHAAKNGHLEVVSFLVSCDWVTDDLHDLDLAEAAQQALVLAAQNGFDQILDFLLDMSEVDVNKCDTLMGNTALGGAAGSGKRTCAQTLLRRGAKVYVKNLKETTPLHMSIGGGHWDVTETLLKEGAGMEEGDSLKRTPLMIAAMEGHASLIELLLSKRARLSAVDSEGLTALGWACLKGRAQAVLTLLEQGADPNHPPDKAGRTPLHLAAYKGNPDVIQVLLDHGAKMEHVDPDGMRPLDLAISAQNIGAIHCFLKKGAKLGPTTWALANDKPEILLILLNKLLEDGNTLYRKNSLVEAAHRYTYALKRLPSKVSTMSETFEQLQIHLLLNLSRCQKKQGLVQEAINSASEALRVRPNCLEALQSRAKYFRDAGQLSEAISDLSEALRITPNNRELHRYMIRVKEELHLANDTNNNEKDQPIGQDERFKFVDEVSSISTDN